MNRMNASETVYSAGNGILIRSVGCARVARRVPSAGFRVSALIALMIVSVWSLQGCGGGSGSGSTTVKSVAITPTTITVPLNTTTEFTAVVNLTDSTVSTNTTVSWEVNSIAGGDSNVGTIAPQSTNQLIGVYTAPSAVPTDTISGVTQLGQVAVTAVVTQTSTSTTTSNSGSTTTPATVTSNTAIVTVGAGSGLTVTPTSFTIGAGGTRQVTALLNGLTDTDATWTISPVGDPSVYGSIASDGTYTAPLSPPPGATVTISAADPAANAPATSTVTIVYSDRSLNGPFAFSYTGNDQSGFLAVAGSFVADGQGTILSGVEDMNSFLTGVSSQVALSGKYVVGSDGRVNVKITTGQGPATWQFALTTNQHGQMILFDSNTAGGGTIDQQSLNALSNSPAVITGSYVFNVLGADAQFNPLGLAGKFAANGAGVIPQTNTILDVNDNGISGGVVTANDRSLQGTYVSDSVFTGTGRGTLTLTSTTTGQRVYAFYAVDAPANSGGTDFVTRLHLIEIDRNAFVAGDMFSAPAGATVLTGGNYVFTGGGDTLVASSGGPVLGAYAAGGDFVSGGSGNITGGILDANIGGTYNSGPAINSCSSYTTDAPTGRLDLKLFTGSGSCPAVPNTSTNEYAVYPTSQGTALTLEIDSNNLSTGALYQQCVPPAAACSTAVSLPAGSFALGLTGQGIFHNSSGSSQPDVSGQVTLIGTGVGIGTLDVNLFSTTVSSIAITAAGSSFSAPDANGRGTAVFATSNPAATFKLIYYLINDSTALLFDQDATTIAIGTIAQQF